uniref:Uncharacterized protein n=1 Tax=Anguilla anguilla TaxID=7936 RepID=A0A0E9UXB2_ANGAN
MNKAIVKIPPLRCVQQEPLVIGSSENCAEAAKLVQVGELQVSLVAFAGCV